MIAVHEIMSASPVTVGPTTSVSELLVLFDRHDFNAFPVVDDGGRLLGIISKLDLLELFLTGDASTAVATGDIGTTRVEDLMHHEIVSVEPRASIAAAGAIMVANNLRSEQSAQPPRGRAARRPSHAGRDGEPGRRPAGVEVSAGRGQLCQIGSRRLAAPGERPTRHVSR